MHGTSPSLKRFVVPPPEGKINVIAEKIELAEFIKEDE